MCCQQHSELYAALCLYLSTRRWNGSRLVKTSMVSVAVVLMAPIIRITVQCCMDTSLLRIACFIFPSFDCFPMFCCGVRKISVVYSMQGIVIKRYNWWMYLVGLPRVVCAILLNCMSQSWPLASAAMHCTFQFSLLLMITLRNLAVSYRMHWVPRISALHGTGILFLGLIGWGTSFFAISNS